MLFGFFLQGVCGGGLWGPTDVTTQLWAISKGPCGYTDRTSSLCTYEYALSFMGLLGIGI